MVGSALSFVWRRATRRQHRSSRSTDPSNRQCASVRSSGFGYRAGPPIPRRLAPPGARAAPRRLEPWWHTTTSSDPWRSGALECRPSLFMRGVPTRPADVGRRQFRPRIGLVRARKRCCARRRRRKKSRGGRRPRRPKLVLDSTRFLPRADSNVARFATIYGNRSRSRNSLCFCLFASPPVFRSRSCRWQQVG